MRANGSTGAFTITEAGGITPFRINSGAPASSFEITAAGDVGVGTTSPGKKLEVAGDVKIGRASGGLTSLFIENTGDTYTSSWIMRANGTNGAFTITEAGGTSPFKINTGSAASTLVVTTSGVEVTGTLKVNGTTMTVPDYVFEPTYQLLPLEQQGEYIRTNKHLPAVGGAQYDDQGRAVIDLGQNQMGMLEELEKAHLYIQLLARQNAELEARLARLEAAQP
ncbi:MAG: hypothetical protein HC897_08180 [Thermoanaerobaculia bacterium]|nr:hypothetical protein [Thermoanaerobaculia bacterium]